MYTREQLTKSLSPINDMFFVSLREKWFADSHKEVNRLDFINLADEWFKSTKINNIIGWEEFPCIDVTMGCTHFIESFILKNSLDNIQVLNSEYAYYSLMGKHGTELEDLKPNVPLIISIPDWHNGDIRPEWPELLQHCEQKNIDISIDFAWLTMARDIEIDLSHPCIKSFGMSMSKYALNWNRVGLRWCKQRTMDSITILNEYYQKDNNSTLLSCGAFMIENIQRDYVWNTYGDLNAEICEQINAIPTKCIHVVKLPDDNSSYGIGKMLSQ